MRRIHRKRVFLSLLPLALILISIYFIPLGRIIISAFMGFTGSLTGQFVGFKNFQLIQKAIPATIIKTLIWTFGSVLPAILLGLVLALICNRNFTSKKVVVGINLLPYAIPLIIVASCWRFVYNPDFGIVNVFLKTLGFIDKPVSFLDFNNAMAAVIIARIWRATPFAFMNYYSALTTIPSELYEAACVDGANSIQRFIHVTLPNLREITASTLIVLTVWTFLVFDIIYGMTGGGPVSATRILSMQIYQEMFSMKNLGTASAWSLIAVVVLVIITTLYWKITDKEGI